MVAGWQGMREIAIGSKVLGLVSSAAKMLEHTHAATISHRYVISQTAKLSTELPHVTGD